MSRAETVSVVVPAHESRATIERALDSALGQTRPPSEVLLVDDDSSDGTAEFVRGRYGASVRILTGRFGGAAPARNAGWRAASAEWVAFLDADDDWLPEKLERAMDVLRRCPGAGWFVSDGSFHPEDEPGFPSWFDRYVDCPNEYFGQPVAALIEVNFVMTHAVVVRRSLLEETGGFDERLSHAEDLDLWIRLARRSPVALLKEPLVRYHRRAGGLSSASAARLQGDIEVFRRLSEDPALEPSLRERAAARIRAARFKLGFAALREGRGPEARRHLAGAWHVPDQVWPVLWAWAGSFAPPALVERARRWEGGKRGLAQPALRLRRPVLRGDAPAPRVPAPAHPDGAIRETA
jgi:hypothetical protein